MTPLKRSKLWKLRSKLNRASLMVYGSDGWIDKSKSAYKIKHRRRRNVSKENEPYGNENKQKCVRNQGVVLQSQFSL